MESKNKLPASNLVAGYIAIATAVLAVVSVAVNNGNSSEKETASSVLETSTTEVTSESSSQNDVDEITTSKSEVSITTASKPQTTTSKSQTTTSKPQTTTSKVQTTTSNSETIKPVQTTKVTEKKYKAQVVEQDTEQVKSSKKYYPTETEKILLQNLVGREYGANWVPVEEKAKVVAVVMNRVNSPRFPNNIWDVVHQPGQFEDAYTSCWDLSDTYCSSKVTDSVVQAVDYYFDNTWAFDSSIMYYYGDGTYNYFS